jgi:transcriptional regulator with XRE-family HTH domain
VSLTRVGKNTETTRRVKALLALAERKGLTQAELARQIGRQRSIISEWKAGRAEPDVATFGRLCLVLEVSADSVLGLTVADDERPTRRELDEVVEQLLGAVVVLLPPRQESHTDDDERQSLIDALARTRRALASRKGSTRQRRRGSKS